MSDIISRSLAELRAALHADSARESGLAVENVLIDDPRVRR